MVDWMVMLKYRKWLKLKCVVKENKFKFRAADVIIMLTTKPRSWTCAYYVLDALCLCYGSAFLIIVNSLSFRKLVLSQAILETNVVVLSLLTPVALLLQTSIIPVLNKI